jgi:drug/metabolite transporter (DMT)-like permease
LTGVVVGFAGIALLVFSSHQGGQNSAAGIFAILISTASWAFGAVVLTRNARGATGITALFIQFFSASLVLWAAVVLSGELKSFSLSDVSTAAWWSLCYLVLISSVCGYGVFIWLSRRTSPAISNSFFYVAPVVAMVAATAVFGEPLTGLKMTAAGISLCGVILIVSTGRKKI